MASTTQIKPNTLPLKTQGQAIEEALSLIDEERRGQIHGLFTRWKGINRAKMKYWRFKSVTLMAGMSGSGKSAILNMIEDDFTNPELNPSFLLKFNHSNNSYTWDDGEVHYEPKIIIIAFKYEMDAADELLRNLSGKVKKSYAYLLSSERNTGAEDDSSPTSLKQYNQVTNDEFEIYERELKKQANRPIIYVENAGNLDQMEATIKQVKDSYPGRRIVITIDHTLLSVKLTEKDDLELMSNTAKLGIKFRKTFGANTIFLGQMNAEIEKENRRTKPHLHFPIKADIHGGNQVYWACDDVLIWHRPELLNIEKYGELWMKLADENKPSRQAINSAGVIHCVWHKSRKNKTGHLWFRNKFDQGFIEQVRQEDIRYIDKI